MRLIIRIACSLLLLGATLTAQGSARADVVGDDHRAFGRLGARYLPFQ